MFNRNSENKTKLYSVAALVTKCNEEFVLSNGYVYAVSREEAKGLFFDDVIKDYDGNYSIADIAAIEILKEDQ